MYVNVQPETLYSLTGLLVDDTQWHPQTRPFRPSVLSTRPGYFDVCHGGLQRSIMVAWTVYTCELLLLLVGVFVEIRRRAPCPLSRCLRHFARWVPVPPTTYGTVLRASAPDRPGRCLNTTQTSR